MNHYESVQQLKALSVREALDSLFFNALALSFAYKSQHFVEDAIRDAQKTIDHELDKFSPFSSDVHNLFAYLLNVSPKDATDEALMNSTNVNLKRFISYFRRIANDKDFNSQMDYYLKELSSSLSIENDGLIGIRDLIIDYHNLDGDNQYILIKSMVNYGMKHSRYNIFVEKYNILKQELDEHLEQMEIERQIEEQAQLEQQEYLDELREIELMRQRYEEEKLREEREEEERIAAEEAEEQRKENVRNFNLVGFGLTYGIGKMIEKSTKKNFNNEGHKGVSTEILKNFHK